jgi:hypothetical protein
MKNLPQTTPTAQTFYEKATFLLVLLCFRSKKTRQFAAKRTKLGRF